MFIDLLLSMHISALRYFSSAAVAERVMGSSLESMVKIAGAGRSSRTVPARFTVITAPAGWLPTYMLVNNDAVMLDFTGKDTCHSGSNRTSLDALLYPVNQSENCSSRPSN